MHMPRGILSYIRQVKQLLWALIEVAYVRRS
jgi:hypothetical protein